MKGAGFNPFSTTRLAFYATDMNSHYPFKMINNNEDISNIENKYNMLFLYPPIDGIDRSKSNPVYTKMQNNIGDAATMILYETTVDNTPSDPIYESSTLLYPSSRYNNTEKKKVQQTIDNFYIEVKRKTQDQKNKLEDTIQNTLAIIEPIIKPNKFITGQYPTYNNGTLIQNPYRLINNQAAESIMKFDQLPKNVKKFLERRRILQPFIINIPGIKNIDDLKKILNQNTSIV